MIRIGSLLFTILLILTSCEKENQSNIDENKMVNVLIDVHFAEAAVQHLTGIRKDTTLRKYYNQIYQIHEIEKADFDSSLALISKNPDLLSTIYQRVQDSIQVRSVKSVK